MKLTETHLRRIIRNQIDLLREDEEKSGPVTSKDVKGVKSDVKGNVDVNKLASKLKIDVKTLGVAMKAAKSGDTTKGVELVAFVKALLDADPATSKEVGAIFSKVTEK